MASRIDGPSVRIKVMLCIFVGDKYNWYTKWKLFGNYQKMFVK